jgi:hypothetical protein
VAIAGAGFCASIARPITNFTYNPKTAALSKAVKSKKRPSTVPAWPETRSHAAAPSETRIMKILKRNNAARSDMARSFRSFRRTVYPPVSHCIAKSRALGADKGDEEAT